jgi:hypothetical protein
MNEAALNGDHGAEAQANAVLEEVQRRITVAMQRVPLQSGNARTLVVPGWPIIITRKEGAP